MSLVTSIEPAGRLLHSEAPSSTAKSVAGDGSFQNVLKEKLSSQTDMNTIFEEASARYGVSVSLLKAVAKAESNFNASAVSPAGAIGVMQLMPATAKSLGVTDPYDARQNIMGGAKYLSENLKRFGDVELALAAYNAGPNAVTKYGGVPPYTETQNYVKKVINYMGASDTEPSGAAQTTNYLKNYVGNLSSLGSYANGFGSLNGLGSYAGSLGMLGLLNNLGSSDLTGSGGLTNYAGSLGMLGLLNQLGSSGSLGSYYNMLGSFGSLMSLGSDGGSSSILGNYGSTGSYGNGTTDSALTYAAASALTSGAQEDEDTVTVNKESFYNAIELMQLQTMMSAERQIGVSGLL